MSLRPLVLATAPVVFVLATSSHAAAQAPGEVAPSYAQPPPPQPVASDPHRASSYVEPLAHRWAIAVGLGAFSVAAEHAPEGNEVDFNNTEVALRYRATRRLELELVLTGGRQVLDNDQPGELANGGALVGARYRFMPERKWNWWISGALGGMVIEHHRSSEEARDAAQRPVAALGVGLERRFRRFAIQAELKSLSLGARKDHADFEDTPTAPPMPAPDEPSPSDPMSPSPVEPLPPTDGEPEALHGASFTLNLSYYF